MNDRAYSVVEEPGNRSNLTSTKFGNKYQYYLAGLLYFGYSFKLLLAYIGNIIGIRSSFSDIVFPVLCIAVILLIVSITIALILKSNQRKNESALNNVTKENFNEDNSTTNDNNEAQEVNSNDLLEEIDVSDDSDFLTMQRILTKVISSVNSKNARELINCLDPSFASSNNVTESNVLNLFSDDDFSYWYLNSMTKQKINDNVSEYILNISDSKAIKNPDFNEKFDTILLKIYVDLKNKTFN